MTPQELQKIIAYIRDRVHLDPEADKNQIVISFFPPAAEEMSRAELNAEGVKQLLSAPWWEEMATDIIETPEYCDPDDPPQQVLEYAKDVVSDYIRKRITLDGG